MGEYARGMARYCIQYEAFDDPEWSIEKHIMDATDVEITDGIAHFRNEETGEAFLIPRENLIAAWADGDSG